MKQIIYESAPRFNKFYLMGLFTNELEECTENDFNEIVIKFRHLYDMKYDGPNRQLFMLHGEDVIAAARERNY